MYHKVTGSSAKLDQLNTSFVGILLGQTPAIGGGGRYDRAACRDKKQTCREVARARRIERRPSIARTLRQPTPYRAAQHLAGVAVNPRCSSM